MTAQLTIESLDHSPEFDAQYRRRRERERAQYRHKPRRLSLPNSGEQPEAIADPEEISSYARHRKDRCDVYFSQRCAQLSRRSGDGSMSLPKEDDLHTLADTFGTSPERLAQAAEMRREGLDAKAKRLTLCGRIGHRVNCSAHDEHKFFQPYGCRCRYCESCGPQWFREKFSELIATLEPVAEHLADEGRKHGYRVFTAKVDFTVLNTGEMPKLEAVCKFHKDMHDFWNWLRRLTGLSSAQYGIGGCDEFGGSNTNLHRHCVYIGPILPQRHKELSALWSIVGLPAKRKREMLRFVRKHGLRAVWNELAENERRFVSVKIAESFRAALSHALKYPAKFLSASTPERLAELEVTFHKTRRFSTGGAFYCVKAMREPGEEGPIGSCPVCGARLCEIVEPWVSVFSLEAEGRANLVTAHREAARVKLFRESGPP